MATNSSNESHSSEEWEGTRGNKSRPEIPPSANSCPDYNPPLWFSTGSRPSLAFLYTTGSQPSPICRSHQKKQVGCELPYIRLQLKKKANPLSAAAFWVWEVWIFSLLGTAALLPLQIAAKCHECQAEEPLQLFWTRCLRRHQPIPFPSLPFPKPG